MSSSPPQIILTSSPDGSITAFDAFSGTVYTHFSSSRSPRRGLVLVGRAYIAATHISSTTASASIHLYNWWSPTALHRIPVSEPVAPLAATPDGSYLFAGSLSGHVYALAIPSGNVIKSCPAHKDSVSCFTLSNDSSLLISGGVDGTIAVIPIFQLVDDSVNDGSIELILHSFVAHDGPVTAIASLMGSSHAVSCSTDCTSKLWNILDGTNLLTITFPCSISSIALDPTEAEFYAAGSDGLIYSGLLKIRSKREVCRGRKLVPWTQKHVGAVVSVGMMNQGMNLVSAAEDGSVCIWNVETRQLAMTFSDKLDSISDMVIASGIGDYGCSGAGMYSSMNEYRPGIARSPGKEIIRSVRETIEMEAVLNEAVNDRGRAIDMLESALEVYERLLGLVLKEARGSTNDNNQYSK